MFDRLETIYHRPKPFEFYTADELWTDEHTSAQMLAYHLNEEVDLSSRSGAFIDRSVEWMVSELGAALEVALDLPGDCRTERSTRHCHSSPAKVSRSERTTAAADWR